MSLLAVLALKVSAILLVALIGAACLRTRSASARHWVLAIGVALAAVAPVLHVLPILPVVEVVPADAGVLGPAVASEAVVAAASDDVVRRLAVTIWLVGAVASVGVLLVGLARLRWLRASSSRVTDGPWHRLCTDLARSCGLKRGVDLLFGPLPGLVATWGWRRPVVMLPASASEWSAERMRVVLLHELAHARRGDWMLQMAAEALRCVWWFNPLAWMVRARLRRESEHVADDLVLAHGIPSTTCATHLVELAREVRKHRRTWLPAPAMARQSHLERRLSTMLNPHTNRRPMTRLARFSSLGVLVLVAILLASLQVADAVEQPPPREPVRSMQVTVRVGPSSAAGATATISGESIEEIVAALAALQERLQVVLGGLQMASNDPVRDAAVDTPIRIGNGVSPPRKIHDAPPVYPPAARAAGVQGLVILEATVDPTGQVGDINILKSVPELDEAAIAAVEQWRYEPTVVDGVPVPVSMTLTIHFSL